MKLLLPSIAATAAIVAGAVPLYLPAQLSFLDVFTSLWALSFLIGLVLNAVEGLVFMEKPEITRFSQYLSAFLGTALISALAALVCADLDAEFTLYQTTWAYIEAHALEDWLFRIGGAAGLYCFCYVAIGSATWPFVRRYYEDPKYGLNLRLPSGGLLVLLQLTRGLITSLVLLPICAAVPGADWLWWLRLSLLLAAVIAIAPLLMAVNWPKRLRLTHAIEISVFAAVWSLVVWWLLAGRH
ncbi:MAG: hypothetical protein ACYTG5_14180 [Planctomycetota bacterium]